MADDLTWDDRELVSALRQAGRDALRIVAPRVADDARLFAPVLSTKPPGEGWSFPPGALKASIGVAYGEDSRGDFAEVHATYVARFLRRTGLRVKTGRADFLYDAVDANIDRPVP